MAKFSSCAEDGLQAQRRIDVSWAAGEACFAIEFYACKQA